MKKTPLIAAVAAAALLLGTSGCSGVTPSSGDDDTITFFQTPGYDDTVSLTALWKVLLAERDITLETQNVDLAAGFAAIEQGSVDGYINTWLPHTHGTFLEGKEDKLVIFDDHAIFDDNRLVFAVPESAPDDTVEAALANADAYGSRIVGIEAGSGMMGLLPDVLADYGASDTVSIVEGSTPAMLASLKQATDAGENIIVTLWTPHWAFSEMPIKVLEDTKGAWGEPDGSYLVTSKAFAEEHADIAAWMSQSSITSDEYASLMLAVSKAATPEEGAEQWLQDPTNRATADSWFA